MTERHTKEKPCAVCGAKKQFKCWRCDGTGIFEPGPMMIVPRNFDGTCPTCNGDGTSLCSNCLGGGIVPEGSKAACPDCGGSKESFCFWCEGTGKIPLESRPDCPNCGGSGRRQCILCGGAGHVTTPVQAGNKDEWRRRIAAEFESEMLAALAEYLSIPMPASRWVGNFSANIPRNDLKFYRVMKDFEERLRIEDEEGLDDSYSNADSPYSFLRRCRDLWDSWWHDLGVLGFDYPRSVQEMLDAKTR